MKLTILLVVLALSAALVAQAADPPTNYICTGAVDGVAALPDGTVAVETFRVHTQVLGSQPPQTVNAPVSWMFLCNLNRDTPIPFHSTAIPASTIRPEVCKAWLNTLLVAQATDRSIALWFSTADSYGSCTQLAQPSSSFKLRETTFGPALKN
jgi:hypothetical protein